MCLLHFQMLTTRIHFSTISIEKLVELLNRTRKDYLQHFDRLLVQTLFLEDTHLHLRLVETTSIVRWLFIFLHLLCVLHQFGQKLLSFPKSTDYFERMGICQSTKQEFLTVLSIYLVAIEEDAFPVGLGQLSDCLLYTSPSPRDLSTSRMPSSA